MSSPSSGWNQPDPDPNHPGGVPPEGQPGWGAPPPAPGYGAPEPSGPGAPARHGGGQRPGQVTAAAVIGIVIGGLGSLFGLLSLFGLGMVFAFDAILGLLALLSLAAAVVVLAGGIQAIQGRSPRLLILGSYASIGVSLLYLLWAVVSGWGFEFSGLLSLVLPVLIVLLLMQPQARQHYASRGISY